jgi:hypothetical protein
MKRSGFKMRSGNSPLAFKMMGSSPVKQRRDPITSRSTQVVNKNQEVSSSDQVKKPGIDTQLVKYVGRKIGEWKEKNLSKNKIKKEKETQAKLNSSNNSTEEDKTHVIELDQTIGANQPRKEGYVTEELDPTSDNSGDQSEVKEKKKKKGWKFDIDWDEVATNAVGAVVTTGIKAGVEALGGNKKTIRKGGSMGGFASQKFSSGSNLFAKKSDDM